jgi:hypothetical protein
VIEPPRKDGGLKRRVISREGRKEMKGLKKEYYGVRCCTEEQGCSRSKTGEAPSTKYLEPKAAASGTRFWIFFSARARANWIWIRGAGQQNYRFTLKPVVQMNCHFFYDLITVLALKKSTTNGLHFRQSYS